MNVTTIEPKKVVLSKEAAAYACQKYPELPAKEAIVRYARELHAEKFGVMALENS